MLSALRFVAAVSLLASSCSETSPSAAECGAGKCDATDETQLAICKTPEDFATQDGTLGCTPCGDVLRDRSGRGFVPAFAGNDPLVRKVYMTFVDNDQN